MSKGEEEKFSFDEDLPREDGSPEEYDLAGLEETASREPGGELGSWSERSEPGPEAGESSVAEWPEEPARSELGEESPAAGLPTSFEEEEKAEEAPEKEKKPGFFARLMQTSPYVVMLGISLLALVIGCGILVVELWRYGFEFTPRI